MSWRPADRSLILPVYLSPWTVNALGSTYRASSATAPTSGTIAGPNRAYYTPFWLNAPYSLQRFWWQNGATVGTDSVQAAIYTAGSAGPSDIVVSCPRTLSAGTANLVQYATCAAVAHGITSGTNTTDATTFATASVTLKARPGLMYALSVVNTHGSGANTVSVATTGGAVTFTSRATTQFNSSLSRVSLFTAVPTADVTDTITITIGSAQTATACLWSLVAWSNVDTSTNDGIVQTATNTGNSTTPSATLSAFGSANNATFGVHGTAQTAATPGTGFIEIHDQTAATPTCGLETEYRADNDTSVDASITSAQWGSIAAEVKSLGTTATLAPGEYYMAIACTGTTATFFRYNNTDGALATPFTESSLTAGLPASATPAGTNNAYIVHHGITRRATP